MLTHPAQELAYVLLKGMHFSATSSCWIPDLSLR